MPRTQRARLAPTPSGYLHRGNAANFLLNARLAEGGELLLRIDDLDRGRFRPEYLDDIFRVIDWLGITVTEGPANAEDFAANWSQEHRMPLYRTALELLRDNKLVFACPCTRKELARETHHYGCLQGKVALDTPEVAWRINTRELETLIIPDRILPAGFTVDLHADIPDFVVRTKAGRPSYQLACTVDDQFYGVNTVGRGQDLLPSTAAQSVLSDLLGYEPLFERVEWLHHPLVVGAEGEKLSKSAGAQGISESYDPADLERLNSLISGWLGSGPPVR